MPRQHFEASFVVRNRALRAQKARVSLTEWLVVAILRRKLAAALLRKVAAECDHDIASGSVAAFGRQGRGSLRGPS